MRDWVVNLPEMFGAGETGLGFLEIAKGNYPGHSAVFITGYNPGVAVENVVETLWDQGGTYTYLSSAATLYISSSSAADVGQVIAVAGLDGDYNEVIRIGVLNGQSQVALDGELLRVHAAQNFSGTALAGDVYIAESGATTGGVPDTTSEIKAKIIQGIGVTHQFTYTVPAGKTIYFTEQVFILGKNRDVDGLLRVRFFGGVFLTTTLAPIYQNITNIHLSVPFSIGEKSDFELSYSSSNAGTPWTVNFAGILATN